ncbi:MAG: hypothetical protein ACOVJ1_02540 [Sediminibacterium sp.]
MPPKHIKLNGQGDVQELGEIKTFKSKPKPYKSDIIENYLRARDRIFWAEGTPEQKKEIEERWKK